MPTPPGQRASPRSRAPILALAGVLVTCGAIFLATAGQPDQPSGPNASSPPTRSAVHPPSGPRLPAGAPAATPRRPRALRPAVVAPPDRSALRPGGSDDVDQLTPPERRRHRAAARTAAAFARAWTRYSADPSDRQAARRVRLTSTAALWGQLSQVRPPAGAIRGRDRYERIAGVSTPLEGGHLEVTVALRDRAGERQYLSVNAVPTEAGWKIAQITL